MTEPEGTTQRLVGDDSFVSLYRRFRPGTFSALRGQPHVVRALQHAVAENRVGHAYLFSGPRGTGKTSTARILAKALNCTDLHDGEPCGACTSCIEITKGTSLDVTELDAASNNGVDAMRDLVNHANLGTPGRWKVYIVDEVHMLSNAAANALLKTLEEPPSHVVFVLATTDPQKVPATIRSRTQHLEFRLLGADTLATLLSDVRVEAGLAVDDESLAAAVRRAKGSARDALSALDQVAAAGSADDVVPVFDGVIDALVESDAGALLVALAELHEAGWGPQQLATELIQELRTGFLQHVAPQLNDVVGSEQPAQRERMHELGLPRIVRTMEAIGKAQIQMRDAPEPQVVLELALVRSARLDLDDSPAALAERLSRIEQRLSEGGVPSAPLGAGAPVQSAHPRPGSAAEAAIAAAKAAAAAQEAPPAPAPAPPVKASEKPSLGAIRRQQAAAPPPEPTPEPVAEAPQPSPVASETAPAAPLAPVHPAGQAAGPLDVERLNEAWKAVHATLPVKAKAILAIGRFVDTDGTRADFALPNAAHADRARECVPAMTAALVASLGRPLEVTLVVGEEPSNAPADLPQDVEESVEAFESLVEESKSAGDIGSLATNKIFEAFPGSIEVTE
jgi:DNA polymerase-3 subunit gamma/tau